jgi:hypothetical protein
MFAPSTQYRICAEQVDDKAYSASSYSIQNPGENMMKNVIKACSFSMLVVGCLFTYLSQATSASSAGAVTTVNATGGIRLIYFQSSFQYEGPDGYKLDQAWPETEPCPYPNEKGTWHWVDCGPNLGTIRLVPDPADSTRLCLEMVLDTPGPRPLSGNQHVKLYECQGREASNYVEPYPTEKEAYWHMEYWFPANFTVATNSWRLIWQFCGEEGVYGNPNQTYSPQFGLIFGDDYLFLQMSGYYYTDGQMRSFQLLSDSDLPKERWVSIVVYVKQGSAFRAEDGTVVIWFDGAKVFERHDLSTSTYSGSPYVIWGIGNYGGPYEPEGQLIYIKDVSVTNQYIG